MYVDKTIFKSGTVTRSSVTIHVCRFAVPIMCNFMIIGCFAKNSARPSQTIGGQRPRRVIDFCGECECNIWAWCLRETCDAIRDSAISGAARKPLRGPMKINAQRPYCKSIFSLSLTGLTRIGNCLAQATAQAYVWYALPCRSHMVQGSPRPMLVL